MADTPFTAPVEDKIPKVGGDIAVTEDLDFQRRWWAFERVIWFLFLVILVLDALGLFGRGWLAKRTAHASDGTMDVSYDRVQRDLTPSTITVTFHSQAVRNGTVQLFVSDSLIRELGEQRVTPQPERSLVCEGGVTYLFPATGSTETVELGLMPREPWSHHFTLRVSGAQPISASVFVMP